MPLRPYPGLAVLSLALMACAAEPEAKRVNEKLETIAQVTDWKSLVECRLSAGLSRKSFVEKIGGGVGSISPRTLMDYERKEANRKPENYQKHRFEDFCSKINRLPFHISNYPDSWNRINTKVMAAEEFKFLQRNLGFPKIMTNGRIVDYFWLADQSIPKKVLADILGGVERDTKFFKWEETGVPLQAKESDSCSENAYSTAKETQWLSIFLWLSSSVVDHAIQFPEERTMARTLLHQFMFSVLPRKGQVYDPASDADETVDDVFYQFVDPRREVGEALISTPPWFVAELNRRKRPQEVALGDVYFQLHRVPLLPASEVKRVLLAEEGMGEAADQARRKQWLEFRWQ